MKVHNILWIAVVAVSFLSACKQDKLDVWTEKGRVWFTSATDTVASFKRFPDETQKMTLQVPISLAGSVVDQDRIVDVIVVKDKRSTLTEYEIERPVVIKAGATSGMLNINVWKTVNLAEVADTLDVGIRSSADLEAGVLTHLERTVILTNRYNKPWWWYDFRMGIWSEAKHQTMIDALGSEDDVRGGGAEPNVLRGWAHGDAIYNLYLLNRYCELNNLPYRFLDGR